MSLDDKNKKSYSKVQHSNNSFLIVLLSLIPLLHFSHMDSLVQSIFFQKSTSSIQIQMVQVTHQYNAKRNTPVAHC